MKEPHELIQRVTELRDLERSDETVRSSQYGTYGVESMSEDDSRLLDYWRAIRKRLWLVIGIALLITMLSAVYMARKPDIYEAQVRVQVDLESNSALAGLSKNNPVILGGYASDPSYMNTQLQILSGAGLLRRVVKTLDLEHNQDFLRPKTMRTRSLWQSMQSMVGLTNKEKDEAISSLPNNITLTPSVAPATSRGDLTEAKHLAPFVTAILLGLKIEPVKENRTGNSRETRLIDIRYDHPDPQVAAKIVNTIADTFVQTNLEKKTETTNSTGDFLQRRIAELQAQIRNGEERLVNYAKNNQILSLDTSQNTVVERLAGLNRQLLEAENDRKTAEAAYRAASAPGAASAMAESDAKQLADTDVKLADLRQKREQLLLEDTVEAPEVKEVDKQIAVLEKHRKESHGHASTVMLTNLGTRYKQALAREQALRQSFNEQRGETLTQNQAAINYRIIQQEIETNKELLNGLLQREKENDVVQAGTPNNISIVDYAITPDVPVAPNRLRTIGFAFALSLAFGIGFAILLEHLDNTVHSTDDVEKFLRLPALAVIPSAGNTARRHLLPSTGALKSRNGNGGQELLINLDARSPLAEAYRQLRTSVLLSTAGHAPKTLLITSSLPGEGKTTTAVNTAMSLAQTSSNVVIIDADMRRPRIHSIFEKANRRGLSTILSSTMSEAEILSVIEQHEETGIHLLPSGPIPPNPAELIGSDQMRRLITTLESTFTHIIIDSPPISSFTDGVLLSSMSDGVLLVVHGGKSSRHIVRRSQQILQDVGAKIFGVILNNVDFHSHDYYYYQHYYRQSYYNTDGESDHLASSTQG